MKRRGLLGFLLAGWTTQSSFSRLYGQASPDDNSVVFYRIRIPESEKIYRVPTESPCPAGSPESMHCTVGAGEEDIPIDYAVEVSYKDRKVRFTPDQLMDILEGKA
jgi:hypothetical protein